jgi:hypothetical protein
MGALPLPAPMQGLKSYNKSRGRRSGVTGPGGGDPLVSAVVRLGPVGRRCGVTWTRWRGSVT